MRHYAVYTGARGSRFVANTKLGPIVAEVSKAADCPITRVYAGQDAAALIHSVGLHTQQEVIDLHARGVPGYGPANPVDESTHCERNDGIAFRFWPKRFRIPWWACGIDVFVPALAAFIRAARRLDYVVTQTYPGADSEEQHVNFRKLPRPRNVWIRSPLKRGSKGRRVARVTKILCKVKDANGRPYLTEPSSTMTLRVVTAVDRFQKNWGQHPDGVVGIHTWRQLQAALRHWQKAHR